MNLYIILFDEAITDETENEVKSNPLVRDAFRLSDHNMLIQSYVDDPKPLGESLGISGESGTSQVGVLFNLVGSYHGYYHAALWDWLEAARV